MEKWTIIRYKEMIREYQDTLDEDDNLKHVAEGILDVEEGLKEFLINEMGEPNPISKVAYDLA